MWPHITLLHCLRSAPHPTPSAILAPIHKGCPSLGLLSTLGVFTLSFIQHPHKHTACPRTHSMRISPCLHIHTSSKYEIHSNRRMLGNQEMWVFHTKCTHMVAYTLNLGIVSQHLSATHNNVVIWGERCFQHCVFAYTCVLLVRKVVGHLTTHTGAWKDYQWWSCCRKSRHRC